jgi:transposase
MFPYDFSLNAFFVAFPTNSDAVDYLLTKGVLHCYSICGACQRGMNVQTYKYSIDGKVLRCTKCKRQCSIRKCTFLEKSKLPARDFLLYLYFFCNDASIQQLSKYMNLSEHTCVDYSNFFREIASWKFMNADKKLGGIGRVVQVDESVIYRPKYNRGHALFDEPKWVFGIYDPEDKCGAVFFVEDRTSETLLSLIKMHVEPGTEIHSDEWRAYNRIKNIDVDPPFTHKTVNHSIGFKNKETGVHTNNVEAYWSSVKRIFKKLNGTSRRLTASYLDMHMYKQRYGQTPQILFDTMLADIEEMYLFE